MSAVNPLFPVFIYVIAFLSAWLIHRLVKFPAANHRFYTIDGLRGFLSLGVFIYHAAIWQAYLQTGSWQGPPTRLLTHFGQISVIFFFMITSFLFVTRLLDAKEKGWSWSAFFISRFFRIVPMYYVSLALILVVIQIAMKWSLTVSYHELFSSLLNWALFTVYKAPLINRFWVVVVNAGVEWTLRFEWLFYFSLPCLALFILKVKPGLGYIVMSVPVMFFLFFFYNGDLYFLYAFVSGAIPPFLIKYTRLADLANRAWAHVAIVICLYTNTRFATEREMVCMVLATIVFTLIALGNTFFGILKTPAIRLLGDVGYSTYLLHGLLLFAAFKFGIGMEVSRGLSAFSYSLVIFCLTPVLVLASFFGFKYVEKPFMQLAKKINAKLAGS
jgi:peptidoglycan/LPS O-acetylase OafA/YrhL